MATSPATPAATHGTGSSQRRSEADATSDSMRAQMTARPRRATPITRRRWAFAIANSLRRSAATTILCKLSVAAVSWPTNGAEQRAVEHAAAARIAETFGAATVRERGRASPLPDGRGSEKGNQAAYLISETQDRRVLRRLSLFVARPAVATRMDRTEGKESECELLNQGSSCQTG